ncbi:unnamed protein product [Meganyctiphanes norvegica]|uniref:Endonuclease/exonuclease/phosphatase domain-containing protein n=1 Tax=Meganyctiphanes norvegica TaxID=48144 RepID=A0AAV2RCZ1_MEGNR
MYIEKINTINIVIYRPPTKQTLFKIILNKVKQLLEGMSTPETVVIISGDFNFPFVEWTRGAQNGCTWKVKSGCSRDEMEQFVKLIELFDKHNLIQAIEEPTREKNTLDLIFTNDIEIFINIDVSKSSLSDHDIIEITTNYKMNNKEINHETNTKNEEPDFRQLNFHNENVIWSNINNEINKYPWYELFKNENTENCTMFIISVLLTICMKFIPRKYIGGKSKIPRERKILLNRMKMLKRTKHRTQNKKKREKISEKIKETEYMLINHRKEERRDTEKNVLENMKKNPKVLFDYIKKQNNRDTKIGPFKINNEYEYDPKEICKILVGEYNSQYSKMKNKENVSKELFSHIEDGDLTDIDITEKDI